MNNEPLGPRTLDEIRKSVVLNLKYIYDPEIPVNIYDLGLIYDIQFKIEKNYTYCTIKMTLTSPGCPVADQILSEVHFYTIGIAEIDEVDINLVFDPPWDSSLVSQEGRDILELEGTIIPQY
ncbi:MAG: DUF59 domain-containing protein [Campylobacteraceae bacterium]|nr:DUF59 domain-containing protein [Campylobacteraceae bacterium]